MSMPKPCLAMNIKKSSFLEKNSSFHHLFSDDHLDDICASLTIFTESIKEKYWKNPTNIAFIFEGNEYISQHLEALVRKYLGDFKISTFFVQMSYAPLILKIMRSIS